MESSITQFEALGNAHEKSETTEIENMASLSTTHIPAAALESLENHIDSELAINVAKLFHITSQPSTFTEETKTEIEYVSVEEEAKQQESVNQANLPEPQNETTQNADQKGDEDDDERVVISEEPICIIAQSPNDNNAMFPSSKNDDQDVDVQHFEDEQKEEQKEESDTEDEPGESVQQALKKVNISNKAAKQLQERKKFNPRKPAAQVKFVQDENSRAQVSKRTVSPQVGTEESPVSLSEQVWNTKEEIMEEASNKKHSGVTRHSSRPQSKQPQKAETSESESETRKPEKSDLRKKAHQRRKQQKPSKYDSSSEESEDEKYYRRAQKVVVVHHHHYY